MRAALCALGASTALVAGACAKKKHTTLYLPAEGTSIAITLDFPLSATTGTKQDFSYVCQDARSLLVSLDVDSAFNPAWDYRFLFGLDGSLWGCSAAIPCASKTLNAALARPYRVAVEGIDVAPADYELVANHNVVCRGVADVEAGMGKIAGTPLPTPSPAPSAPSPAVSLAVDVVVPMLRVGDVNGTFSTAGARGPSAAASLLGPAGTAIARTTSGGMILEIDGNRSSVNPSVLAFDPRTIESAALGWSLPENRFGASPAGFVDSAGAVAVLLAGGADTGGVNFFDSVEILRRSGPGAEFAVPATFRGAALISLPAHREGGVLTPAVFLVGGIQDSGGTPTLNDRYLFFFPAAPVDTSTCSVGAVPGAPAVCSPGSGTALGDGGHFAFAAGIVGGSASRRLFLGPGYQRFATSYTESTHSYVFNPETKFAGSALGFVGSPPPILSSRSAVSLNSNIVASFSSLAVGGQSTSKWAFSRADMSAYVEGQGTLIVGRRGATQTALLDGRVIIAGGGVLPSTDARAVEIYTPNAGIATSGTFSLLQRGAASCSASTSDLCVRLGIERSSAIAVRIDGSRTWLNGSVVIVGGMTPSAQNATGTEIFVPAYACNGAVPVVPGTSRLVQGVDFCDRTRARRELTSPTTPQRVSE